MPLRMTVLTMLMLSVAGVRAYAFEYHNAPLETQVEALFAGNRNMADIKLTIDHMVDPSVDVAANLKILDGMSADIERMREQAAAASDFDKLAILRRYIYEPGPWNGGKAFSYDMTDPLGRIPKDRLLSQYLAVRKGNCVSMPILLMVLGSRMGLKMTLAEAPEHLLVKFTGSDGRRWNIEATSGGGFSRDRHYQDLLPALTEAAIRNGVYLRGLPRDEAIAAMATDIVAQLTKAGRLEDAEAVSERLLAHAPGSVQLKLTRADVLAHLLKRDIIDHYKTTSEMTPKVRAYADDLYRQNMAAFAQAEALGWRDPNGKL